MILITETQHGNNSYQVPFVLGRFSFPSLRTHPSESVYSTVHWYLDRRLSLTCKSHSLCLPSTRGSRLGSTILKKKIWYNSMILNRTYRTSPFWDPPKNLRLSCGSITSSKEFLCEFSTPLLAALILLAMRLITIKVTPKFMRWLSFKTWDTESISMLRQKSPYQRKIKFIESPESDSQVFYPIGVWRNVVLDLKVLSSMLLSSFRIHRRQLKVYYYFSFLCNNSNESVIRTHSLTGSLFVLFFRYFLHPK